MSEKIYLPAITSDSGFHKYLQEINKIDSLSQEEEFMLAKAYLEHQDIDAAHKLVTSHLKLVAKIALSYKNYGLPVTDLVSEGNLGLMQAVKKYDPDLGHRLSTYAMWWIKASIQEYILRSWSLVKIGTTAAQKKLFFSLRKIKHKLSHMYSRAIVEDDMKEVANILGVKTSEAQDMNQRISGGDISLNNPSNYNDEEGSELIESIADKRPSQELVMARSQENNLRRQILLKALSTLNEREAYIIKERKLKESPATLDDLSHHFGISKERVRQIESRAFEKLQEYAAASL
ncbi:MAG UNVERIFIED_CONTAM: RNA polymerase sigma factor RpoH [Rickettsiaceae bacterium]|jgi:RNA polymerase sigma-32 factor